MSKMKFWKCTAEGCKDDKTYNYKGLCRECTEYDKAGNVVTPVKRVQVSKNGTVIVKPERVMGRPVTLQDFKTFRRSQKRMTKKQMKALEVAQKHAAAQMKEAQHAQKPCCSSEEDCEPECETLPIMPIGESVGEEE
tara:strand:- start:12374 stop:12784 length:411 start_codon:yes stop_codon:yes gene_type:complete